MVEPCLLDRYAARCEHGRRPFRERSFVMEIPPMRLLAITFFLSIVLWVVLTIVLVLSPSTGVAKADGIFSVIALGSLLMMVALRIYERSTAAQPGSANDDRHVPR
jgi:hypothetical protein